MKYSARQSLEMQKIYNLLRSRFIESRPNLNDVSFASMFIWSKQTYGIQLDWDEYREITMDINESQLIMLRLMLEN